MPRGSKDKYSDKQKRQAEHIEEGYKEQGVSEEEAESRAWATVNKMNGGGKKSGSGRGKKINKEPAKKGGRIGGKKSKGGTKKKGASTAQKKKAGRKGGKATAKKKQGGRKKS